MVETQLMLANRLFPTKKCKTTCCTSCSDLLRCTSNSIASLASPSQDLSPIKTFGPGSTKEWTVYSLHLIEKAWDVLLVFIIQAQFYSMPNRVRVILDARGGKYFYYFRTAVNHQTAYKFNHFSFHIILFT